MKSVILVIGGQFQPHACGFIREFEALGGKIDGILVLLPPKDKLIVLKKMFRGLKRLDPRRLKNTYVSAVAKFHGMQRLEAVKATWDVGGENSWDLLTEKFDIFQHANEKGIPMTFSPTLLPEVVRTFTSKGPVVFPMYGGGILEDPILNDPNAEFINAHMGEMPRFRGMNVIEWAILEDLQPRVAVMTMNAQIDGGDVIWTKDIPVGEEKTIAELRKQGYVYCYKAMAEGIFHYAGKPELRQKQAKGAKYYYRMHPRIRKMLSAKLPPDPKRLQ